MSEEDVKLDVDNVLAAYQEQISILTNQNILLKAQLIQVGKESKTEDSSEKEQS